MKNKKAYYIIVILLIAYVAYRFIHYGHRENVCRLSCEKQGIYEYSFRPERKSTSSQGVGSFSSGSRPEVCKCITPEEKEKIQRKKEQFNRVITCMDRYEGDLKDTKKVAEHVLQCEEYEQGLEK